MLYEKEGAQKCFGRADGRRRFSEEGHARMAKVAVCLGHPVVDCARRDASTAALRLCLDERAKIS